MKGRSGARISSKNNSNTGINDGLIAAGTGFLAGSASNSGAGGTITTGDAVKYGVQCSADDQSEYCKNVRGYNQFQMGFNILMSIVGVILGLVFLYFLYKIYSK